MGIHKKNFKNADQIPPELTCTLCNHIFLQPYQVLCRHDHVFCKACLDKYLDLCTRAQQLQPFSFQPQQESSHGHHRHHGHGETSASNRTPRGGGGATAGLPPTPIQRGFSVECPECKKLSEVMSGNGDTEMLRVSSFRPTKFVERMVQAQSVHCPTTMTMWCHWTGPLKDTEEHLESCNFAFEYTCAYRYLGCSYKGGATDVAAHVRYCALQPSQPSYSTNSSASNNPMQTSSVPSSHHFQQSRQFETSTGHGHRQGPISPPQSSPPVPMVPPPHPHHHPHPHHRPMAQRAAAHPGHGHGHHYQPCQQQPAVQQRSPGQPHQQPLFFHTPVLPESVPPLPPSPPAQSVFERAGSYDVSQGFEQLSIDELQKALDAELDDGDDFAFYSPSVVAATATHMDGVYSGIEEDEDFVQVERTDSMDGLEVSEMTMSPVMTKPLSPMQEIVTQQPTREATPEPTLEPAQEVDQQQTVQDVSQPAVNTEPTQESVPTISPIITQQIQEEALLLQCGQQMEQEDRKTTSKEREQDTERIVSQEKQASQPELQCAQVISVSELPTLSPQMRHRLSPSPSPPRDHPAPENVLPPAQRRRIIVDEEESNGGSGDVIADADYAEEQELFGEERGKSSSSAAVAVATSTTARADQLPRRSITYKRQDPLNKNSRVLRDITDAWVPPREARPQAQSSRSTNAPRSPTSSSSTRPGLESGMGLTAEVFRVLNQHVQQNQPWSSVRRRLSEPGQRSPPRNSATSTSRRSLGRFNPLPMRVVPAHAAQTTANLTSPQMRPSGATTATASATTSHAATPLASPPASSSDDETEPENAQQLPQQQQRQRQQPLNPDLANFLLLTQNPPHHLVAEAEPHSFVPFVAYKPRYLKSRKKKGKAGRTYGQPIVRDKDAHDRYQNLAPPILTPDITSPEDSIASQAHLHH
ncbi:hypothetical protein BGW39_004471 [Mortierella sp. 14UC]|nr:hypothetical protein BGW39_004471 [Mortierella sp. 14UC]